MTGNGDLDLIIATDEDGGAVWYEQGTGLDNWTQHTIVSSGTYTNAEGIDAGDVDGDGDIEVFILDQEGGELYVAKSDTSDPTGSWSTETLLNDVDWVVHTLMADLTDDGEKNNLIYSYEGSSSGDGGIYWLEFTGGNALDSNNWENHEIAQIEGGWGLARQRVDLSDNGEETDIVFGTRAGGRNSAADGGVYWAEPATDPRDPWTVTEIDGTGSTIHVDVGDFSGDGDVNDVVICQTTEGTFDGVAWYDGSDGWSRTEITDSDPYFNVRAYPRSEGPSDIIGVRRTGSYSGVLEFWRDSGNGYEIEHSETLYKEVDRIPIADIDGDGSEEFVTASETEAIDIWEIDS